MHEQAPSPASRTEAESMAMAQGELDTQTVPGQISFSQEGQVMSVDVENPMASNTSDIGRAEGSVPGTEPGSPGVEEERGFVESVGRKAAIHMGASAVFHTVKFGVREGLSHLN